MNTCMHVERPHSRRSWFKVKFRRVMVMVGAKVSLHEVSFVCFCVIVLTRYHASEGGGGVAALSSGRDMRRVAGQSGAG